MKRLNEILHVLLSNRSVDLLNFRVTTFHFDVRGPENRIFVLITRSINH